MQQIEIGDITLEDLGERLRVSIAAQQDASTWSVAGASVAVGWILAWITHQNGAGRDIAGHMPLLDKTLRQVLEEMRRG